MAAQDGKQPGDAVDAGSTASLGSAATPNSTRRSHTNLLTPLGVSH